MKRKLAIVLALALAFSSMTFSSMTVSAKLSARITKDVVQQIVVSPSISNTEAGPVQTVPAENSATLPGTTFTTASGQVVDAAAVAIVSQPLSAAQAQAQAASLVQAMASPKMKIVNFTGVDGLSLTDSTGALNVVSSMSIGLMTAAGVSVSQNGSISTAFVLDEILGGKKLAANETVQALYQRADGTWVAVPVVIINGAIAIALPAFGGAVNVTFLVTKGAQLSSIPADAAKSPRT